MSSEESIHKRLERLRRERGLTAKYVAREIGVPESTYREWEYGRGLRLPPYQKLSQLFAISVTELVTGESASNDWLIEEVTKLERIVSELKKKISSRI